MERIVIKTRLDCYQYNQLKESVEKNEKTTKYILIVPGHYTSLSNESIEEFILDRIITNIFPTDSFKSLNEIINTTLECVNILPDNFDPCKVYPLTEFHYTRITCEKKN